jgi:hypothetical protein
MKKQILSLIVAFSILFQLFFPSFSFALTSGPSQPEFNSFEPYGTSQMVDPFTGDFTYNIPLLVVPGPNGGYPVNLSYHAGIGMEQEASWVGLGWNINAGVINHQLRGLADDYKGDTLIKKMNIKPGVTLSYGNSVPFTSPELWGFNFQLNISKETYYNNYKGLGFSYGLGLSAMQNNIASDGGWSASLNVGYDTQQGFNLHPSLSLSTVANSSYTNFNVGTDYNSREGIQSIFLKSENAERDSKDKLKWNTKKLLSNSAKGAGLSFCKSSHIPSVSMPMKGSSFSTNYKVGGEIYGTNGNVNVNATYTKQSLQSNELKIPAYGYNYSDFRLAGDDIAAMDFNRENDVPTNDNLPNLALPVFTYDVYSVKGQGIASVFRSYRSDVGILYDAAINSEFGSGAYGGEIGLSSGTKVGVNMGSNYSHSYSGKWKNSDDAIDNLNFQSENTSTPLYEPYYFKSSGEQTVCTISDDEAWKILKDDPIAFGLTMELGDTAFYPKVVNEVNNASTAISNAKRSEREKRIQSIEKKTIEEITNHIAYNKRAAHIYSFNQFPSETVTGNPYPYQMSYKKNHHIAEISMLNPDGERYTYGIPVYNKVHKDVMFSIDGLGKNPYDHSHFVSYDEVDASISNSKGEDHFFTSTELPPYIHSYLLTQIVSHDYIDLTGNGPSEDDFGYYVKFNYSKKDSIYRWRIPYFDANHIKGYDSNENDDKASYSYGDREEYYLNSIETKTHIAEFHLSDRHDAYGVNAEYHSSDNQLYNTSQKQKKLDEIKLYSKNDRTTPIKTIHFGYNYELCGNVKNNDGDSETIDGENINTANGKLTLKKVWFTYADNDKGKYSPYLFNYNAENVNENPDYDLMQMDRWGNYKPDTLPKVSNADNPYVNQKHKNTQDELMGAWNLKSITLPSGGVMSIEYESDDYSHVQNIPATQMMKVLYMGNSSGSISQNLDANYLRIYFEPERPLENFATPPEKQEEVYRYIKGINEIYFKAYIHLKSKISMTNDFDEAYDYVRGYAELDTNIYGYQEIEGVELPYVCVRAVNITDKNDNAGSTHPFRKAAWQYMKVQRPDLLYPAANIDGPIDEAVNNVMTLVEDIGELLTGYYKFCNLNGYASEVMLDEIDDNGTLIPSFIRLNSPDGIKLGGGHRVKKITLSDEWNSMTHEESFSYGQQYEYLMPDGSSSGVAEYEPLVGGDENAIHKPIHYSNVKFLSKVQDNALFLEEPIGEAFYPSPNVGYRRVLLKALDHADVTKSASGITEYKFYTAKEFPVQIKDTQLDDGSKYQFPFFIPFVGTGSFNIRGFSQGYGIYLNDMHGKTRSIASFSSNAVVYGKAEELSVPVTQAEHIYLTETSFDENKINQIKNIVTVLDGNGVYRQAEMGIVRDLYVDERENESYAVNASLDAQIDYEPPVTIVPTAFPVFDFSVGQYRSVVTVKMISQNGILSEVRETTEGSTVNSKNLMYDAETGIPLLTSVTNEFDAPIYHYNYAAHWSYSGMQGAYKNIGAKFQVKTNAKGIFSISDAQAYFNAGDELTETSGSSRKTYYVQEVLSNTIKISNEEGSLASNMNSILQITRSGHKNLQNLFSGNIISLTDPVNGENIQNILDGFNASIGKLNPIIDTIIGDSTCYSYNLSYKFLDCLSGDSLFINFSNRLSSAPDSLTFYFSIDNSDGAEMPCIATITFPEKINDPQQYNLTLKNNEIIAKNITNGIKLICNWNNPDQCFSRCLDEILNASAITFNDDWNYNYADAGNPVFETASDSIISNASISPYRFGEKGIYRPEKSYLCLTERKQSSPTNIGQDGTYETFTPFDWEAGANNPSWTMSNEITQYSPFGFETENKNALGIYSSVLYGYDHSLVTTVSSNASSSEMAYDGFEDYAGVTLSPGQGHFNFKAQSGAEPAKWKYSAHTGSSSMLVVSDDKLIDTIEVGTSSNPSYLQLQANNEYDVSVWIKLADNNTKAGIRIRKGNTILAETYLDSTATSIDGWRKLDVQFTSPATANVIIELRSLALSGTAQTGAFFDDIRLRPFNSTMKTFVYDSVRLWLIAEHDDQNFSTFYNYDEEGILTQIKKETERGIMTIQAGRNNTRKNTQ